MSETINGPCSSILVDLNVKMTASKVISKSFSKILAEGELTASKPVQHKDIKVVIKIFLHQSLRYKSF